MEDKIINELVNEEVLSLKKVLLIDENGNQIGVLPSNAAFSISIQRNLDLVCVAPGATIPVCKLMNYGKFKFDQQKRAKEAKKKSKGVETKEIQLTYGIAKHDMETKAKAASRFLDDGNYVRIVLRLKGREITMQDFAKEKINQFLELCSDFKIRKELTLEGRDLKIILEKSK